MNINVNDLVSLDDNNKYVVLSKLEYEKKIYYYLIDVNNRTNIMICYLDGDELVQFNDDNLIKKLIPLFLKQLRDELSNYSSNNN